MTTSTPIAQVDSRPDAQGLRFAFGANWANFLAHLDEERVRQSVQSLARMLDRASLAGRSFLDIGSGSGLSSLAAERLGASRIHSLDSDADSVACTAELRRRYAPDATSRWTVERGSALDAEYMGRLGQFDVVYSWGVLHHTGDMWRALGLAAERVAPGGQLFIAVYNDQGGASARWRTVKRLYNRLPGRLRPLLVLAIGSWIELRGAAIRAVRFQNPLPFHDWRLRKADRGMTMWYDLVDWIGGYPFEVAKPEELFEFCRARGFRLDGLTTCGGGMGCNQLVFTRID